MGEDRRGINTPLSMWRSITVLLFVQLTIAWDQCPGGALKFDGAPLAATPTDGQQVLGQKTPLRILNAGKLQDGGNKIAKRTTEGRTYFGVSSCSKKASHQSDLLSLNLLNRSVSFNVDLSTVGCNCNLAFCKGL